MNTTLIAAILSAPVPTFAIVLSILLNRSDYHKLDSKIDAKIDAVRSQQHADMLRLYELFGEHSQRLTRLETQVQGR